MAIYLCHGEPDLLRHDADVVATRPGAVALSRSAFHPGGGGQVADRGAIEWSGGRIEVAGIDLAGGEGPTDGATGDDGDDGDDGVWWHVLADSTLTVPIGPVEVHVDGAHRSRVAALHTVSHVLNAFVFDEFAGALVTGAQINGDGTGRMDFDLPAVDNDRIRALEAPVNEVIGRGVEVRSVYVDAAVAAATPGLVRSRSVAPPPTPDGHLRIIDIVGVDRQACGGTHLANTAQSPPVRLTKVENKGRHNRRVRFAFADGARAIS